MRPTGRRAEEASLVRQASLSRWGRFFISSSILIPLAGLLSSILATTSVTLLPTSALRVTITLLLTCFLPGWALVEGLFTLFGGRPSLGERLILGVGASYAVTIVGGLWLYYALSRVPLDALLVLYTAVGLAGFGLALRRRSLSEQAAPRRKGLVVADVWWLLGLLVLAAYFRFYFLSYSDFRGDEAEVLLRAVAAMRGEGQPILSHTKGPAETLLTTAVGLLYGAFSELTARLPFAVANWLAVVGTYLLGHSLFGRRIAVIGGALVAINGWFVTYGRTAQYQNLVLLLSVLGMWCYVRFYRGGSYAFLVMGTLLLATATFGHYEGAAAAPAAVYLLAVALKRRGTLDWKTLRTLQSVWPIGVSVLVGTVIILSFYAPFLLNPTVSGAQSHVAKRFGSSPPYNNWDAFYVNGLFYNAIYYVIGVGSALLLGTLHGIRRSLGEGRWSAVAAIGLLPILLLSWTGLMSPWYALMVYLGLMTLFLLSPRVGVAVKGMLLWMSLPFGLYLFGVVRPGNHFYIFMPPLLLLTALTLDRGLRWLEELPWSVRRWALPTVIGTLLALYGLSTWYEHLVFMRTDLEYMLTYPRHRRSVFWSDARYPFDIRIGWGFPYRLGWQTISELYRNGQLAGDWYANDENNSISWYTLGWPRNPCYPRYYVLTEVGYHDPPLAVPSKTIERHYVLKATVQVNGQPRLRLYEFAPLGSDISLTVYDEPARYPTPYRQEMMSLDSWTGPLRRPMVPISPPQRFKPHPDMLADLATVYDDPRIVQVRDEVSLLGYDVDDAWAVPGGVILLTLYWQTDSGLIFPYKVFTHVEDTRLWAQADDEPGCAQYPTNLWRPGDRFVDRHAIFLPDDMPAGIYPLQVGIYEIRSGLRMDTLDELGNPIGNFLPLAPVAIRSVN